MTQGASQPMKFVIPTAFSPTSQFCEMAILAEQNGIDVIAISDHVAHPEHIASRYPYTADGSPRGPIRGSRSARWRQ